MTNSHRRSVLACIFSYLTHEQGRKSKIGQYQIKEHKSFCNLIYSTSEHHPFPRIPDYSKMAAGQNHIHTPDTPPYFAPLSHIAKTDKSVIPVMNLIGSRLNQGEFTITEWKSNVIPSESWVRKDIIEKPQVAMEVAVHTNELAVGETNGRF